MTIERKIASFFNLTNENWMKHSNPWSVWTRYCVLPIIVMAFWSRLWIGWMFLNPIFFKKPKATKNWASKAVLGERVYLNRDKIDIPDIHKTPLLKILNIVSSIGMGLAIWAIVQYSIWGAIFGVALAYLGKSWYLDRMVLLYEDMKSEYQEYSKWEY